MEDLTALLAMTERVRLLQPKNSIAITDDEIHAAWSAIRTVKKEPGGKTFGVRTHKVTKRKYILRIK